MYKLLLAIGLLLSANSYGQVYGWGNSPLNPVNSPYALDNSPYALANSPYNLDNSPYNFESTNNVFNMEGDWVGYIVQTPSGNNNMFIQDGEQIGYNN